MRIVRNRHAWLWLVVVSLGWGIAFAENIDPGSDQSQYAWSENAGWINAEPSGDGGFGVQVGDSELSGRMWGENIGWISLSCKNELTCSTVDYGVANDGSGVLSGYAWSENAGWIDFSPSTSGVTIDHATGEFSGFAWAENVGWISFNCSNTASCGTVDYKVKTAWICSPPPAPPVGTPVLVVDKAESASLLSWTAISGETGYDIVHGDLLCLRSGGSFTGCTSGCLDDNRTTKEMLFASTPSSGNGYWFLVRGQNCGGGSSYGTTVRDTEIPGSGNDCS